MFANFNPAVKAMRAYVELVKPWAGNEWDEADFKSAKTKAYRMDPSHTIFPIPERPLPGIWERIFLGEKRADALAQLIAWVKRFNDTNQKLNATGPLDRYAMVILLHAGVIGKWGSGGLFDVFTDARRSCE